MKSKACKCGEEMVEMFVVKGSCFWCAECGRLFRVYLVFMTGNNGEWYAPRKWFKGKDPE